MESFYNEIAESLIDTLEKYAEDNATYEQLQLAFAMEEMAFKHINWESIERNLRNEIFNCEKLLLSNLNDVEIKLKNIEKELDGDDVSVDGLVSHSLMLSRNKMPVDGYNVSSWYLPFCPNHNHIERLYEDENEEL